MKEKIKKAPGVQTNSYVAEIKSLSVFPQTQKRQAVNAKVLFISENNGESLHILDPSTKKQIILPFGPVEALIEHTRNKRIERDLKEGV
jgi:hypothetical protein